MSAIAIVADDAEAERRLRVFVGECRGAIDHMIPYSAGSEFHVAVPDDKLQLLLERLVTSGGFLWRQT